MASKWLYDEPCVLVFCVCDFLVEERTACLLSLVYVSNNIFLSRMTRPIARQERKGNIRSPSERSRLALQDRLLNALGSPPRTVKESPTSTHRRCATDPNDAAAGTPASHVVICGILRLFGKVHEITAVMLWDRLL